jgi:hypothetical protein
MGCAKQMTREEVVKKFTKKFVSTKYKEHREKCLFELEKAMLPATQPIVERMLEHEKYKNEILKLRRQVDQIYRQIREYEDIINNGRETTERKVFVRKCPNSECRGFLSTQWKCNLCERKTCKDCNESIDADDEHKCDPNAVETAKLLAKDSKPCPKCGEMIFKIDGCDQIWCTQCRTAFSWNTGRIETGIVHNPHYFEWLKNTGKNMTDDPERDMHIRCGREIDHHFVRDLIRKKICCSFAIDVCRNLIHFRAVELERFRTDHFNDNQDLRVAYLRKRITEEQFRTTLQKREKARQKKEDFYRLFAMLIQCVTEIIYRYHDESTKLHEEVHNSVFTLNSSYKPTIDSVKVFDPYFEEILALINYVNDCLKNISIIYNCQQYVIAADLTMSPVSR